MDSSHARTLKPAYLVHMLTASGVIPAALAVIELTKDTCDPRIVFAYLLLTTLIDAIDGPLAREFHVKRKVPDVDGRVIDDLLDYLTFAFIPLLLIWRMDWMPVGWGFTVTFAMMASLLGFAHKQAKDESRGVFRGFPSYWNLYAIYAGLMSVQVSPWLTAITLWVLAALTVVPVWMIYPNLAPRPWKKPIMLGGVMWTASVVAILVWDYPRTPAWLWLASMAYPLFYIYASAHHVRATRSDAGSAASERLTQ